MVKSFAFFSMVASAILLLIFWGNSESAFSAGKPLTGHEKVVIYGYVVKQGAFPWKSGLTVRQLVYGDAGGVTPLADIRRVKVFNPNDRGGKFYLWRKAAYEQASKLDGTIEDLWDKLGTGVESPSFFSWLDPGRPAKAMLNLNRSQDDCVLDPDDVIIVGEKTLTF